MATLLAKSGSSSAVRARPSSRSAGPFLPARALARRAVTVRAQQQPQPTAVKPVDEKRWEEQVTAGKVRNVTSSDVRQYLADGWVLLDVRPPSESKKAPIVGAVQVPLFVDDESMSLSSFIKRASAFGMGGWWLGGTHMIPNQAFMGEVQAKIPKDAKVLVGCQKGLRSLAACEQLSKAGYPTIAWVNGGFDSCKKGEVPTVGDVDIRYAGIGGLSELIGWTEVQQEQNKGLGSAEGVIKLVALVLVLDLALFGYEYIQAFLDGRLTL